jgi:hypothetical protein
MAIATAERPLPWRFTPQRMPADRRSTSDDD